MEKEQDDRYPGRKNNGTPHSVPNYQDESSSNNDDSDEDGTNPPMDEEEDVEVAYICTEQVYVSKQLHLHTCCE